MATSGGDSPIEPQVEIVEDPADQSDTSTSRRTPEIPPLNRWLNHVSYKYLHYSTLEVIKFTFSSEIARRALDGAKTLIDLFYLIVDLYNGDEARALSRLVYTLDLMGRRRYGKKAVRDMADPKYNLSEPPLYDPTQDSRAAQLRQCLAEIIRHFTDKEEYQISAFFSRANQFNPHLFSVVSLFDMLLHEKAITEKDQELLARGLTTIGADHCIDCLIEYRRRNKLETRAYEDLKNPDYKSTKSTHTNDSSNRSVQASSRGTPVSFYSGYVTANEHPVKSPLMKSFLRDSQRYPYTGTDPEAESQQLEQGSGEQSEHGDEHIPLLGQNKRRPPKWPWFVAVSLALFAVVLVFGVAGSAYGTFNAAQYQYSSQQTLLFGNSTAPLIDHLLPYYLNRLESTQIIKTNPHQIDLYLVDSNCEQLDDIVSVDYEHLQDQGTLENLLGMYLLPGSEISYNICALTNASREEHDVFIEVYVLKDLNTVWELLHTNDYKDLKYSDTFWACYRDSPNPYSCCSPFNLKVTTAGYYSIWFTINNPMLLSTMQYNYTKSVTQVTYDAEVISHADVLDRCSLSLIDPDYHCVFEFNGSSEHDPRNMNDEQCVLAHVHVVDDPPKERTPVKRFTEVDITYNKYSVDWLTMCVSILSSLLVLLLTVTAITGLVCCVLVRRSGKMPHAH